MPDAMLTEKMPKAVVSTVLVAITTKRFGWGIVLGPV